MSRPFQLPKLPPREKPTTSTEDVEDSSPINFADIRARFNKMNNTSISSGIPSVSKSPVINVSGKKAAPPPPPQRGSKAAPVAPLPAVEKPQKDISTPPSLPARASGLPPVRKATRPADANPNESLKPPVRAHNTGPSINHNEFKWSEITLEDKRIFFGWLDEFFDKIGLEQPPIHNSVEDAYPESVPESEEPESEPEPDVSQQHEQPSMAEKFANFFSPSIQWRESEPWYTTKAATPDYLVTNSEEVGTRSYSSGWSGDQHFIAGGVLFSDLSACWYKVEWSSRDRQKCRRMAAFTACPEALPREDLLEAHETYGETVAGFAEGYEGTGQWCARGECWDLANEALKSFSQYDYVPLPLPSIRKTHGHLIYEGHASGSGFWRGGDDRIRRGDIVQWLSTTVVEKSGRTIFFGFPDHTAVIVKDQVIPGLEPYDGMELRPQELGRLEVVEQSVKSPPHRNVIELAGMQKGDVWIYRPIGLEKYIGFRLEELGGWPEGLEPMVEASDY